VRVQADERLHRRASALTAEGRERLPILAVFKCCDDHQLSSQDRTLTTSSVKPNLFQCNSPFSIK